MIRTVTKIGRIVITYDENAFGEDKPREGWSLWRPELKPLGQQWLATFENPGDAICEAVGLNEIIERN